MSSENKVLGYLESRYDQDFVVESTKKESVFFSEIYGEDKVFLHPKGQQEIVFLVQESNQQNGDYWDNYLLAKWAEELKSELETDVKKELPSSTEFKVLLEASPDSFNQTMKKLSVHEYLNTVSNEAFVVLKIGIKTEGKPNINQYAEGILNLYKRIKNLNLEQYIISVGFVDASEDISDYLRTSYVNNIAWSNLDAKVYGDINLEENIDDISKEYIIDNYQEIGGSR
jgi:hypothetical protein